MYINVILINQDTDMLDWLNKLIPWTDFGCQISGSFSDPREVLRYAGEMRPDIAFLDIHFDGAMDGFEMARRLRLSCPDIALVLVTENKDFDIARECLRAGFENYVVREECTPEVMRTVLEGVQISLHHKQRKNAAYKRQLLREMIKGKKAEPRDIVEIFKIEHPCDYSYLLIRRDRPFQLDLSPKESEYYEINWHSAVIPPDFLYIGAAYLEPDTWGILLATRGIVSARRYWEATYSAAVAFQRSFFEQQNDTASVAISKTINDPNTLPEISDALRHLIKNAVFSGIETVFFAWDDNPRRRMGEKELSENIEEIRRCMYNFDFENLSLKLSVLFSSFISPIYDEESLRRACIAIDALIEDYERDKGMPVGEVRKKEPLPDNCKDIRRYYDDCIHSVMIEANHSSEKQYSPKVKLVIQYINRNYAEDISVNELGGHFDISGDYLRHLFKKQTGQGLLDYITSVRIKKAKQLLREERYRVVDVARITGFRTPQYFSQVFKKMTGINPTDFADLNNAD